MRWACVITFKTKKTALVVNGSPEGYAKAIRWVIDPANDDKVAKMCNRAHNTVRERFSLDDYIRNVLDIMDEV